MNILSKLKHLHNLLLHFIWKHSKKKELTIDGYFIQYLPIPKYFLWSAWKNGKAFTDGHCLIHRQSKTVMVFLSHGQCASSEFRYILFHEFIEGQYWLRDDTFIKNNSIKLQNLYDEFQKHYSIDVVERFEKSLNEGQDRPHIIALLFELDLAKREMGQSQFDDYMKNILKKRL